MNYHNTLTSYFFAFNKRIYKDILTLKCLENITTAKFNSKPMPRKIKEQLKRHQTRPLEVIPMTKTELLSLCVYIPVGLTHGHQALLGSPPSSPQVQLVSCHLQVSVLKESHWTSLHCCPCSRDCLPIRLRFLPT